MEGKFIATGVLPDYGSYAFNLIYGNGRHHPLNGADQLVSLVPVPSGPSELDLISSETPPNIIAEGLGYLHNSVLLVPIRGSLDKERAQRESRIFAEHLNLLLMQAPDNRQLQTIEDLIDWIHQGRLRQNDQDSTNLSVQ